MSNLVVTIISIALVAVAALMAIFYGGAAYNNATPQALASLLLSQTQQIYAANTQYMFDHGSSNFEDFPDNAINSTNGKYLTSPVSILNLPTNFSGTTAFTYCPKNPTDSSINGYQIFGRRTHANFLGQNVIVYNFVGGTDQTICTGAPPNSYDLSLASSVNHPLVQICKQINSASGVPSSWPIAASGIPYSSIGGGYYSATYSAYDSTAITTPPPINICFIKQNAYWGAGYSEMLIFLN